jgi:hypothetical protein
MLFRQECWNGTPFSQVVPTSATLLTTPDADVLACVLLGIIGVTTQRPSARAPIRADARDRESMPETSRAVPPTPPPLPRILSSDAQFDSLFDEDIRALSEQHWTPVRVAARAAAILTQNGATRILDVGAGVGKFCIVGSLTTGAEFIGVEQRAYLVAIARSTAAQLDAGRAAFVHANMDSFSFDGFNGIYLYNPFYEQIAEYLVPIDGVIPRSPLGYRHLVRTTVAKLAALLPPVAVVTFNGFGGSFPPEYQFLGDEPAGNDRLELWVKK